MFRASRKAPRSHRKGLFSSAAMALALATGGLVGMTAMPATAIAQDYSRPWQEAAQPIQEAINKAETDAAVQALISQYSDADDSQRPALLGQIDGQLDGVFAKIRAIESLATTPDDKYATGQFNLNFGNMLSDAAFQRAGLKLMVDSGKPPPVNPDSGTTPEQQRTLFSYYVGSLSVQLDDFATARQYLQQAYDAGFAAQDIEQLLAESYFLDGDYDGGFAKVDEIIADREGAISENLFRRTLQIAYEEEIYSQISKRASDLVRYYPEPDTWNTALRVVLDSYDLNADESLDLFRLMRATDSLIGGRELIDYIDAADPRRRANEVLPLIEEGIASGLLDGTDVFVAEARSMATTRADEDRAEADNDAEDARSSTDFVSARAAAENFMALGRYADAEEMFDLALARSPEEIDRIRIRIGVAQALQGNLTEARATFMTVEGKRAYVATMWLAYLDVEEAS
jgi:tetratricopeptide (TPR) repeat protein